MACVVLLLPARAGEIRIWTAAVGGYTVEAELIEVTKDDVAVLRRADRTELRVPLDRLSEIDRRYAAEQRKAGSADAPNQEKQWVTADQVEAEAQLSATAKLALIVYQAHLNGDRLEPIERRKVEERLPYWKGLAADGYVRLGKSWMTEKEAIEITVEAHNLIVHSVELLRLHNDQLAKTTLEKASRLDPGSMKADFLLGLGYSVIAMNDTKAVTHFGECLRRVPEDVSVLNNIAISEFFLERYPQALQHWQQAVDLSPRNQTITDNLATVLDLNGRRLLRRMPSYTIEGVSELYRRLLKEDGIKPPKSAGGFAYLLPYGKDWEGIDLGGKSSGGTEKKVESQITGGGSGFVIAEHYVLTNHHVIDNATAVLILNPGDEEPLPAEIVAQDAKNDLAILKCEKLTAPPVALADALPRRGTDVMVLGFPEMFKIGSQIKATRGTVTALPDEATGNYLFLDAAANPGNSGGPVVDQSARVVCVMTAVSTRFHSNYSLGVPIITALPFLKSNIPDFKPTTAEPKPLDWPDVDGKMSPSTVLILRKENRVTDVGLGDRTRNRKPEDKPRSGNWTDN